MKRLFFVGVVGALALASCTQAKEEKQVAERVVATDGFVYKDDNVEFVQLDEHTWHGRGNKMFNESVYLIEGEREALLIDAGTVMPGLRKIVESIVEKPVTLVATHVHPDHTGMAIGEWDSIWMNAADEVLAPYNMENYQGEKRYLTEGQIFDLGGREIEVVFCPGHTPGSTLFVDKKAKYGFSSDAFGSSNLLIFTDLSTEAASCARALRFVEKWGLTHFYPGHFGGKNIETPERIREIMRLCEGVLDGSIEKEIDKDNERLRYYVDGNGIRVRFGEGNIR
ncbi:MAG: MBL fold metallo-hydrolase [Bacteroidia bacterium]|nr:MBL fold metallo-hydrolase [Bacteroidia bacterium]